MIYLIGGSGAPNYGDELIIYSWLKTLKSIQPQEKIIVDNNNEANSKALFGRSFPSVHFTSALKTIRPDKSAGSFIANVKYGLDFFKKYHWKDHSCAEAAIDLLRQCSIVHLYGGGYINTSLAPSSGFLLGLLAAIRNEFNIPVVGTGIGLTPLNFKEGADVEPLKNALRAFDFLELREAWSFACVRDLIGDASNTVHGLDDAFLFPAASSSISPMKKRLHLSCCEAGNILEKPAIQSWLKTQSVKFDEVVFWQCIPYKDQRIVQAALNILPDLRIASIEDLLFDGPPAHSGDYMLSMRYHPHLMASRLGVHGQFVADSPYYMHKHGAVVRLGSNFSRLRSIPADPEPISQHFAWRDASWVSQKQDFARFLYRC